MFDFPHFDRFHLGLWVATSEEAIVDFEAVVKNVLGGSAKLMSL